MHVHHFQRLFYIEVNEYDDGTTDIAVSTDPIVSLHALTYICVEETVHIQVIINNQSLLALLHSRSTHNFISDLVAHRIWLSTRLVRSGLNIAIDNGDKVGYVGLCDDLHVHIDVEDFMVDY